MKKILTALSLLLVVGISTAQARYYYERHQYKTTGYRGSMEVGYAMDVTDMDNESYKNGMINIRTTHGYQATQNFFIGVGIGLDAPTGPYSDGYINLPLYGAVRLQANHSKVVPFVDCKIGYSFNRLFEPSVIDGDKGSLYVNPSIGLNIVIADNLGMNISLGYNLYQTKLDVPTFDRSPSFHEETYKDHMISLRIGFEW